MPVQAIYFIIDATHADFPVAKAEADASQEQRQPGTTLSWRYNFNETKVAAKVIGADEDWYKNISWYNHPMILNVYTDNSKYGYADSKLYLELLVSEEWTGVTPFVGGSPV